MPRINKNGSVSIPKALEKSLNWEPGTELTFHVEGNRLITEPKITQKDIEFARRTEAAYREAEKGKYVETSTYDFLKKVRRA